MNTQIQQPVQSRQSRQDVDCKSRKSVFNVTEIGVLSRLIAALFGVIGLLGILNETVAECRQYLHFIRWPDLWICWVLTAVSFFILGLFWATVLWDHEVRRRQHRHEQPITRMNWRGR